MAEELMQSLEQSIDATLDAIDPSTVVDDGQGPIDTGGTKDNAPLTRQAPKSWAKEMHDHWGKLDPALQDYIDKRETEIGEGFKKYGQDAEYARALRAAIDPFKENIRSMGATSEAQAIAYLFNIHTALSNPATRKDTILNLAKNLGVDLGPAPGPGGEPKWEDPALKAIKDELNQLKESVTTERTAAQQAQYSKMLNDVQAFSNDPAHPHFEAVADHIVLLLQNPAYTLEQAYEQACWANPEVRLKVMAEAQTKAETAAREKAEQALKAKGTKVRGTESGGSPGEALGSIDDTLRSTLKNIRERAA